MTKQELLDQLQDLETQLHSKKVDDKYKGNIEFTEKRSELGDRINDLENAAEADIAERLDQLSPQFQSGIDNLNAKLKILAKVKEVLTILATILDLAVQVLKIVAV